MEIIKKWKDERYGAENTLYKLPKGTLFLHTIDPKTADSVFAITSHIGSFYNDILKVKGGTAHFLEHILAGNPNQIFKTKKQIDNFEFGTRKYPKIYSNAWTNRHAVVFYGTSNQTGESRLLKRVISMMQVNPETFNKYIEKERKIIASELGEKDKPEKNSFLKFCEFAFGNLPPEYKRYGLGTEEDIKTLSDSDLKSFFKVIFNQKTVVLSLQSNQQIGRETQKLLNTADEIISQNSTYKPGKIEENISNKFMYKHFHDEKATNIGVELDCFERDLEKIDYNERAKRILSYNLVNYLIFEELREKKGYVYSSETQYNKSLLARHNIKGLFMTTSKKSFNKALNLYFKIIKGGARKFLNSQKGKRWLESQISNTVFPNTMEYDSDYARTVASRYLEGSDIYRFSSLRKAITKLTSEDIANYVEEVFLNTPHLVWLTSDLQDEEIYKEFRKTEYYKYQSKLPTEPL